MTEHPTDNGQLDDDGIRREVENVSKLLASARKLLGDNELVDLSEIEGKVRRLCEAARHTPPENQADLVKSITGIIGNLDILTGELSDQHATLQASQSAEVGTQAQRAYTATPKPDNQDV